MSRVFLFPGRSATAIFLGLCLAFVQLTALAAEPEFPKLTGRVVDQANLLPPPAEARVAQILQNHEAATTEQLVVVTPAQPTGSEYRGLRLPTWKILGHRSS